MATVLLMGWIAFYGYRGDSKIKTFGAGEIAKIAAFGSSYRGMRSA
jgi:hypothetical protein